MKRRPSHHLPLLLLSLTLNVGIPALTPAQQDSARLAGAVRSSLNGLPIRGVMIAVRGTQVFDVSDSAGAFALAGLPSGPQVVRILYGDSLSYEHAIKLRRGKTLTLSVLLDVDAVELAPIVVEARSTRADRSLAGFYERKQRGFGRFYTPLDLERRRGSGMRSLLGESGVWVRCGLGYCLPVIWTGVRQCVLSLYLDGAWLPADQLEFIRVEDLAAVEVYKREFDIPLEFQRTFGTGCGAMAMWSRR